MSLNKVAEGCGVGLDAEIRKGAVIVNKHLVHSVMEQLICAGIHLMTDQQCIYGMTGDLCQLPCLAA